MPRFQLGGNRIGSVRELDRDAVDLELLVIEHDHVYMFGGRRSPGRESAAEIVPQPGRYASQTRMHAKSTIPRNVTASFS